MLTWASEQAANQARPTRHAAGGSPGDPARSAVAAPAGLILRPGTHVSMLSCYHACMTTKQLVSVRIERGLWRQIRQRALELDLTAAEIVEAALVRWLTDPPKIGPATNPHWLARPLETDPDKQRESMERLRAAIKDLKYEPEE